MAEIIHPFYESHRGAMEAAMRHRLDLAEAMFCERAHLSNIDGIRQEVMDEFEIVLTQMPYVGGAASRMSDFFMRLMGFMAISRVLRRHGVSLSVIGEIERETYKAQLLTVPEAERLASGWHIQICAGFRGYTAGSSIRRSRRGQMERGAEGPFCRGGYARFRSCCLTLPGTSGSDCHDGPVAQCGACEDLP